MPQSPPFQTGFLNDDAAIQWNDMLPAYYPGLNGPELHDNNVDEFLAKELSVGKLETLDKHLWFAGARRLANPLHQQFIIGRKIAITERMDLHLIWTSDRRLFVKPLPAFLLDLSFWKEFLCCKSGCLCCRNSTVAQNTLDGMGSQQNIGNCEPKKCPRRKLWMLAVGFLYSWVCLISYKSDYRMALENNLLPSELNEISWKSWRKMASEILSNDIEKTVHPRFLRAELRLARLDTIHRLTVTPPFYPYLRRYWDYSSLFRANITLLASATIFVALILTAMQVGLATDQLKESQSFMAASYGFTVFAILGPPCALGIVSVQAAWNLGEFVISKILARWHGETSSSRDTPQV